MWGVVWSTVRLPCWPTHLTVVYGTAFGAFCTLLGPCWHSDGVLHATPVASHCGAHTASEPCSLRCLLVSLKCHSKLTWQTPVTLWWCVSQCAGATGCWQQPQ
jgi:hypothetical protein